MTSSPGNASAVFDRYRAEGHTLFDPDRLTRLAASADRPADSYDELLEADGAIRPAWADLARIYQLRGPDRLRDSAARLAAAVSDDGVVYNEFDGQHTVTRDWDVDAVPLVIDGVEWAELEKAITQRSMLLDLLLREQGTKHRQPQSDVV